MNLSPHFTLEELTHSQQAVRSGIDNNTPSPEVVANLTRLAAMLERVRMALGGKPINISSGYRCVRLNTLIGGARTSQHCQGLAVDFTCPSYGTPRDICHHLIHCTDIPFDQLIFEGTWVHLSLSAVGTPLRNEVLTAVFEPGRKTRYLEGLA